VGLIEKRVPFRVGQEHPFIKTVCDGFYIGCDQWCNFLDRSDWFFR